MCRVAHNIRWPMMYYRLVFIFAVLERRLAYNDETECNFVYLIFVTCPIAIAYSMGQTIEPGLRLSVCV